MQDTNSPATMQDSYGQSCHKHTSVRYGPVLPTIPMPDTDSPATYTDARYGQSCHLYRCQIRTVTPHIPMPGTDSKATYTDARLEWSSPAKHTDAREGQLCRYNGQSSGPAKLLITDQYWSALYCSAVSQMDWTGRGRGRGRREKGVEGEKAARHCPAYCCRK